MSSRLNGLGRWLDTHVLSIFSLFLLIFIPLYPKLPLFEAIPGYLVRVRIEDILVLATGCLWLIQTLRGKVAWKNPYWGFVALYAGVGLLSVLSGIFLLHTIPLQLLHIGKSGLHFFRYLEYFSLLFFMFSSLSTIRQIKISLALLVVSISGAALYGFGQLYWQWPVYSTMNREFSKGEALTLTADARLNSTFGGHYDLAAYLVIVLPIVWSIIWHHPRWWVKGLMLAVMGVGTWLLIASGSKTALLAWAVGMFLTTLLCLYRYRRIFKLTLLLSLISLIVGGGIGGYFWFNPHNTWLITHLRQWQKLPLLQSLSPAQQVLQKAETVFVNHTQTQAKPYDLTGEGTWVEVPIVNDDGSISYSLVKKEEEWSANAIKYGLSMGIRLDTLWPQALRGEAKNLLVGSGYGTLNKTLNGAFIEADSTDNNLLRTLGETGLLGWLVFYGLIGWILRRLLLGLKDKSWVTQSLTLGMFGGTIGLLANAMIIDVFAASKVAFTFWALVGITAKSQLLTQPQVVKTFDLTFYKTVYRIWQNTWPWLLGVLLLIAFLHRNPLFSNSRILSFSDDPWATQALTTARCGIEWQTWTLCRETAQQVSDNSYLYTRTLAAWLRLFPNIGSYYYLNLSLTIISFSVFYLLVKRCLQNSLMIFLSLGLYVAYLFLSHKPFSPIDVNLSLVLVFMTSLGVVKYWATRGQIWGATTVVLALLSLSTFSALTLADFVFLLVPFLILGLFKGWESWWQTHITWRPHLTFTLVTTLVLFFAWREAPQRWYEVTAEYRGMSDSLRATAIQTANNYFTTWATQTNPGAPTAQMLTTDNPYLWDFYRNQYYQLLPLSSRQPFFDQAPHVWGERDYTSIQAMTKQALEQNQPVFVSEFALTPQVGQPEWQELFDVFNLDLVSAGCDEDCHLYQVTDEPVKFENSESFNQLPLQIANNRGFNFTFMGHRWHTSNQALNHEAAQLLPIMKDLQARNPDFSIMTGNLFKGSDEGQAQIFMRWWGNQAGFPFYFLPGNYDEIPHPQAGTHLQSFRVNHTVFILLDFNEKGEVSQEQQLAFYNLLLDVKRSPEIKNLFIFTHQLEWLAQSQGYEDLAQITNHPQLSSEPRFYQKKILPKLVELEGKEVFVVAGDLKPLDKPAVLYHQDTLHHITYVASGINNHPSDVYLLFTVEPEGKIAIAAHSPTAQPLQTVESYNLDFWRTEVPNIRQPQPIVHASPLIPAWLKNFFLALLLGLMASLGIKYQTKILQQFKKLSSHFAEIGDRLLKTFRK